MGKNWTTFEVLRQSRHDWLNKIQIIKGNLELNKIDSVKGYIEEIIIECQQDARLSNLALPKFGELLMTANWSNWKFECEYEVIEVFEGFQNLDNLIYEWTNRLFSNAREAVGSFYRKYPYNKPFSKGWNGYNLFLSSSGKAKGLRVIEKFSIHIFSKRTKD